MHSDTDFTLKDGGSFAGSLSSLGKTTTEIYRRTAQESYALISDNLARLSEQFMRLSTVKKPEDLITFQKDVLNEDIAAIMQNSQRLMHLFMENIEDLTHIYSTMRDSAVSATKSVARSAVKTAEKHSHKEER